VSPRALPRQTPRSPPLERRCPARDQPPSGASRWARRSDRRALAPTVHDLHGSLARSPSTRSSFVLARPARVRQLRPRA